MKFEKIFSSFFLKHFQKKNFFLAVSVCTYSKTLRNTVSVLYGSIGICLNRTLYCYLFYMYASDTAMHQPKTVHYIAMAYTLYLFQCSFVSLSQNKGSNLHLYVLALSRRVKFCVVSL